MSIQKMACNKINGLGGPELGPERGEPEVGRKGGVVRGISPTEGCYPGTSRVWGYEKH